MVHGLETLKRLNTQADKLSGQSDGSAAKDGGGTEEFRAVQPDRQVSLSTILKRLDSSGDAEAAEAIRDLQDLLWDHTRDSDSYGVYGSDFDVCGLCEGEDSPGVLAKGVNHKETCPLFGHWSCRSREKTER